VTISAIVTPTVDVVNLVMVAVPMCLLFFVGIFGGYLIVLRREKRTFPWREFWRWMAAVGLVVGLCVLVAVTQFHYRLTWQWPFLVR
jgi:sec-independent protein translocase protein TatC